MAQARRSQPVLVLHASPVGSDVGCDAHPDPSVLPAVTLLLSPDTSEGRQN